MVAFQIFSSFFVPLYEVIFFFICLEVFSWDLFIHILNGLFLKFYLKFSMSYSSMFVTDSFYS